MSRKFKYVGHPCDDDFEEKIKELLLYRKKERI